MIEVERSFENAQGIVICFREWRPAAGDLHGAVLIVHGLSEHSGRYRHVAAALTEAGFACFGIDQLGHGKSGGTRAYIPDTKTVVADLRHLYDIAVGQYPRLPVLLFGHSMGSVTGLEFALRHPGLLRGIALSGTAITAEETRPVWLLKLCLFAARYLPKLRMSPPGPPSVLTHDEEMLREWREDPLIDKGMWRVGTSAALLRATRRIRGSARELKLPILAMHGTADHLAPTSGAYFLQRHASSKDVTVKIFDGMRHELVNETCREEVIGALVEWMLDQAGAEVCVE